MAAKPLRTSRPIAAFLLGVAGALAALVVHLAGLDHRAELNALDLRFRYGSRMTPSTQIVHVDIDPGSIAQIGRWPWPREKLAAMIAVMKECGAKAVVMDILLTEPQELRFESESHGLYDPDAAGAILDAPPVPMFDDAILSDAIASAGNVFLPILIDPAAGACPPLDARVRDRIAADPNLSLDKVLTAERAGGAAPEDVARAYLRGRAMGKLARFAAQASSGGDVRSGVALPPLVTFARSIRGSGFVTFVPDDDGVLRRIPLAMRADDGRVYPQFALFVAAHELDAGGAGVGPRITVEGGCVVVGAGEDARRIPIDEDAAMLVNWPSLKTGGSPHLSAARICAIGEMRDSIERNRRRVRSIQAAIAMEMKQGELLDLLKEADRLFAERVAADRARYVASLYDPTAVPPAPDALRKAETDLETKIDAAAAVLHQELKDVILLQRPAEPKAQAAFDKVSALRDLWDRTAAEEQNLRGRINALLPDIRQAVAGKLVLVGSTDTGAADFIPTPLGPRTPGVVMHANVVNTILSGEFLHQAPRALDLLVILLAGSLVAELAATRPVLVAAPVTAALAAAYIAFNALVVFARWHVWLALAGPLLAMVASFLVVTAFRQLTEERAKRRIKDMFAHALSPALVDRLLDDPSLAQLGGQKRSLSCMFSDIAGFTPLSERLGPAGTVRLLNRYFDRVTDVVQNRGGGYLNKFLGDGVFCFFGAPVLQDDHPARAITAAVECQKEIRAFNEELAGELGVDVRLSVRIGISTGDAMVGNCGSTQRMDYTAIGDCVNLAARLEAANKFFGTRILVEETAWRLGGEGFLARPFGEVMVTGQQKPVRIWNVLGRRDDSPAELVEACDLFARAMECFQAERYAEAEALLGRAAPAWRDDKAARIFGDLYHELAAGAPGAPPRTPTGDGVVRVVLPWARKETSA